MQYSAAVQWLLIVAWFGASAVVAWRARRTRTACLGGAFAAAPAVAYSMLGYGLLPMGGLVHVGVAGLYGGVLHWIVARWKKSRCTPEWSDVDGSGPLASQQMKIQLVPPNERYRDSFLRGLREFREEGLPWWMGGDVEIAERDFGAFVRRKLSDSTLGSEIKVPKTHFWAVADEEFVGRLSIHHELNDALRLEGGHIGYDTVPSYRGRGVASEMLRLALPMARELGLDRVLITCDEGNKASIRVIERNGGVLLETKCLEGRRSPKRYYWIALDS